MVTANGRIVDGDDIIFILARAAQQDGLLQGGIVGTLMSNFALEKFFTDRRIPFVRAKVGDRYVMEELVKRDWRIGGENSGHIINRQFHSTGDGIIAGLQVLTAMQREGRSLDELLQGFVKFPQALVNVRFQGASDPLAADTVQAVVQEVEQALGNNGRVLLRKSGTEPLIRVMVEGKDANTVQKYAEEIANEVESASN